MGEKVLVIGIDEVSSEELASMLEDSGIDTVQAHNGIIMETLRIILPSIVVIEEKAEQGGWDISSRIRRESDVPILLLGNGNTEMSWVKAAAYDVDCYLSRPISPRELVARVRAIIRRNDNRLQKSPQTKAHKITA